MQHGPTAYARCSAAAFAMTKRARKLLFLGGRVDNQIGQLFGNLEYRPAPPLLLRPGEWQKTTVQWLHRFSPRSAGPTFFIRPHLHSPAPGLFGSSPNPPDMYEKQLQLTLHWPTTSVPGGSRPAIVFSALPQAPGQT